MAAWLAIGSIAMIVVASTLIVVLVYAVPPERRPEVIRDLVPVLLKVVNRRASALVDRFMELRELGRRTMPANLGQLDQQTCRSELDHRGDPTD